MSFFQNTSRSDIHTRSKRINIYKRICAVIFIGCSILMPVILDLVMPFNVTREALISDKICEISYEKAVENGIDMSRDEASLDKLLDVVLKIDLREEQEKLINFSAPQTGARSLDEIFSVILNRSYESASAVGFQISIDDVSIEKNSTEIKRTIVRRLNEKVNVNLYNKKYDDISVTQEVLEVAYEKASGIIEDKVWENARTTAAKDISTSQVIGTISDNFNNIRNMNNAFLAITGMIAAVVGQIAAVVISFIGANKSKICIYILMVGYALGILFYIFFPLAGMNFSSLNTTFPVINKMVTIPGEISKYLLLDLLLRFIALIAIFKFKRVKYDAYGTE